MGNATSRSSGGRRRSCRPPAETRGARLPVDDADLRRLLDQLEAVWGKIGIRVRYEILGDEDDIAQPRSGLCRLKGSKLLIVDERLGLSAKCRVLAEELERFDLSRIYLQPAVRRAIGGEDGDEAD